MSKLNHFDIDIWLQQLKTLYDKNIYCILVGCFYDKCLQNIDITTAISLLKKKYSSNQFKFIIDIVPVSFKSTYGYQALKKTIVDLISLPKVMNSISYLTVKKIKSLQMEHLGDNKRGKYIFIEDISAFLSSHYSTETGSRDMHDDLIELLLHCGDLYDLTNINQSCIPMIYNSRIIFFHHTALETYLIKMKKINGIVASSGKNVLKGSYTPVNITKPSASQVASSLAASTCVAGVKDVDIFVSSDICSHIEKNEKVAAFLWEYFLQNKIFIYLPNVGQYFANCLLPTMKPITQLIKLWTKEKDDFCYGRVFRFASLPIILLVRIFTSILNIPGVSKQLIWKSGLLIKFNNNIQILIETYTNVHYNISVQLRARQNSNPRNVRKILKFWRDMIENIRFQIESFCPLHLVNNNEFIPCIHCLQQGNGFEHIFLFPYESVLLYMGRPFIFCNFIESYSRALKTTSLAPDILLLDFPQISENDLILTKELGKGAFGTVFLGELASSSTPVAVKVLSAEKEANETIFRQFQREVYLQSKLNHNNIVKLHGVTASPPRMILQLVKDGRNLFDFLYKDPEAAKQIPLKLRYKMAIDIANGLHHMQSFNPPIVHRDLRSPNIFIDEQYNALIGDFGMAVLSNPVISFSLRTWQWMAPEGF